MSTRADLVVAVDTSTTAAKAVVQDAAGAVVAQPDLGAVDVGVDRLAEALVEAQQQLGRRLPDAGGDEVRHATHPMAGTMAE